MKEIKGIGFCIPSDNEDDYIKLDSLSSLSECDIAIFDTSLNNTSYSTYTDSMSDSGTHNGRILYNHDSSARIIEHSAHWNREIKSYLGTGKTLFLILSEKKDFYIHTGRKEFSGTGRNRQITNIVTDYTNYRFLPKIEGVSFNFARGNKIISTDNLFTNFLKEFQNFITYESYIICESEFRQGFVTKNKDKILGGLIKAYGGNIVFLPKINFEIKEFTEYDKKDKAIWSKEAKNKGIQFIKSIIEIDTIVRQSSDKTPRPEWLDKEQFQLKKSQELLSKIDKKRKQIDDLNNQIQLLKEELSESEKLNDLLFETGKALEGAVIFALSILGYKAENYDDGVLELDQVIISPEGARFIGECEGKDNKSIDISKFRQLSDALNEDYEREEVNEKAYGILFGNPFRLTEPNKRKNPFTDKCLKGAEREKIGLIETSELYKVAKYLLENKDEKFKKICRESIFENLGSVIKFPISKTIK